MPPWPTTAEAATLRFLLPVASLRTRLLAAIGSVTLGVCLWSLLPLSFAPVGLLLVLAGHLLLWVRTQTTAPGGATPQHEDLWAPVEDDWLQRVDALEKSGERWDVTPWDVSNVTGCLGLLCLLGALAAGVVLAAGALDLGVALRLAAGGVVLFVPLWLNGMRTTWNPSELRKKGEALAAARETATGLSRGEFDVVPTLALREGRRGKYPVDARLMLRPRHEDASGFLGVQLQVAMNNVQGTDYPYLYAVVLGKESFRFPDFPRERTVGAVRLVYERGQDKGVRFLVVRQHADEAGGWHTPPDVIAGIVAAALELARSAWRANQPTPSA
ncbi:MAG TPA: hypothetical protein VMX54_03600 [Vicinamibacteria bacterium]|nr:hypothetical protein [Vicinamibacteria bacterium]